VEADIRASDPGRRQRICDDRFDHSARQSTSAAADRGAKKGSDQAIERSKGGRSTKIHATVDALGNPTGFHLTGGQACDLEGADVLLPKLDSGTLLADKGFHANQRVLIRWQEAGKTAVIPPKANRKV
jgi:hypothetical protein